MGKIEAKAAFQPPVLSAEKSPKPPLKRGPGGLRIVDFFCPSARLVIELDGGQHYTDQGLLNDAGRDRMLSDMGLIVLRFSNLDVLTNMDGVIAEIVRRIEEESLKRETKSP